MGVRPEITVRNKRQALVAACAAAMAAELLSQLSPALWVLLGHGTFTIPRWTSAHPDRFSTGFAIPL
jgi:hypothetical protein